MNRKYFMQNFAIRLTTIMKEAGFASSRSSTGVKIKKLAEVSSCSQQMARRYVIGDALPDVDIIYNISKWLNVSPGWLMFGEESTIPNNIQTENLIQIEQDILEYILFNYSPLFKMSDNTDELVNFFVDIVNDATHIEADKSTIIKLIDISINSAKRFNPSDNNNDKLKAS